MAELSREPAASPPSATTSLVPHRESDIMKQQRLKKRGIHPFAQLLNIDDLDDCDWLEHAAFDPIEAASREKVRADSCMHYSLSETPFSLSRHTIGYLRISVSHCALLHPWLPYSLLHATASCTCCQDYLYSLHHHCFLSLSYLYAPIKGCDLALMGALSSRDCLCNAPSRTSLIRPSRLSLQPTPYLTPSRLFPTTTLTPPARVPPPHMRRNLQWSLLLRLRHLQRPSRQHHQNPHLPTHRLL